MTCLGISVASAAGSGEFEPNDDSFHATPVQLNGSYGATVETSNDEDWYVLRVNGGTQVEIVAERQGSADPEDVGNVIAVEVRQGTERVEAQLVASDVPLVVNYTVESAPVRKRPCRHLQRRSARKACIKRARARARRNAPPVQVAVADGCSPSCGPHIYRLSIRG